MSAPLNVKLELLKSARKAYSKIDSSSIPQNMDLTYAFFEDVMLQKRLDALIERRLKKETSWAQLASFWVRFAGADQKVVKLQEKVSALKAEIAGLEVELSQKDSLTKREQERLPNRLKLRKKKLGELEDQLEKAVLDRDLMVEIKAKLAKGGAELVAQFRAENAKKGGA